MHALVKRHRRVVSLVEALGGPVVGLALVVGVWWTATRVFAVDAYLLPAPPQVAGALIRAPGFLLAQAWVTCAEMLVGFGVAAVAGVASGVALASSRLLGQVLYAPLLVVHAAPKVALAPLLVVWMGFGASPRIVMVVLMSFFPIMASTAAGLAATPGELVELARALAASPWHTFAKIRFPAALPHIFAGVKTALPLATVGAVIGEVSGGSTGLEAVITQSGGSGDMDMAFAAIALLCAISMASVYTARGVQLLLRRWVHTTSTTR